MKESKWVKMPLFEKNVQLELVEKLWNQFAAQQILPVTKTEVYMIQAESDKSCIKIDLESGDFWPQADLHGPIYRCNQLIKMGSDIYVLGKADYKLSCQDWICSRYNMFTNQWTSLMAIPGQFQMLTVVANIRKRFIYGFCGQTVVCFDTFMVNRGWKSKTFPELNQDSTLYSAYCTGQTDDETYEISVYDLSPSSNSDNWLYFYAKIYDFGESFISNTSLVK